MKEGVAREATGRSGVAGRTPARCSPPARAWEPLAWAEFRPQQLQPGSASRPCCSSRRNDTPHPPTCPSFQTMSAAETKPKKLRKSKGAFGKDGVDPRKAAPAAAAPDEAPKQDKKRKAEDDEAPAAAGTPDVEEAEDAAGDDAEAKKEKKRLKKEKKAAKAALAAAAAEASAPLTQEEVAVAPAAAVEEPAAKGKKAKKDKKKAQKTTFGEDAAPVADAAPASAPVADEEPVAAVASSSKYVAQKTIDAAGEAFLATHAVTVSHPYQPMLSFAGLPISGKLSPAFKDFKEPSPIQACSWPPLFDGKDVVGIAETGSGKTLGFGVRSGVRWAVRPSTDSVTPTIPSADPRRPAPDQHGVDVQGVVGQGARAPGARRLADA